MSAKLLIISIVLLFAIVQLSTAQFYPYRPDVYGGNYPGIWPRYRPVLWPGLYPGYPGPIYPGLYPGPFYRPYRPIANAALGAIEGAALGASVGK
ncbi:hypothetical protein M3Y97_00981000 [Aphelenchoides bicaudatus]|nr:hypothetical protein M3Y97_00981000 [Aphelenchoides bicaudatus]